MHWAACCPPTGAQVTGETCLLRMLSGRAHVQEGEDRPHIGDVDCVQPLQQVVDKS